jgi:GNAT superfamily N-acetyltransferase
MMKLTVLPPVPPTPVAGAFVQTITLTEGTKAIGIARWHTSASTAEGVVQLLDIHVDPPHRRQGHGGRLFKEVIAQATSYFKTHRAKLRRVWAAVEHEQHVNVRAFLTARGFHHITTMKDLYRKQDQLFYTRSFD